MPETVDLSDTNLALVGSEVDLFNRKNIAETEDAWRGAGQKTGVEVWRVENRWEGNVPIWGVRRWTEIGTFHDGDSFVVLHTTKKSEVSDALLHDIHYWIGKDSTQDEYGVAAVKAVELDDFFGGRAIQHREIQMYESQQFKNLFPTMEYREGGFPSGFKKPPPPPNVEYALYLISKDGKSFKKENKPVDITSLDHFHSFVLDLGSKVYVWHGDMSSGFIRHEALQLQREISSQRGFSLCKAIQDADDAFWAALGGSPGLVRIPVEQLEDPQIGRGTRDVPFLWRLSDESGAMKLKKEKEGKLSKSDFDSNDVFFVDAGDRIFGWGGKACSPNEKRVAILLLQKFAEMVNFSVQCAALKEGQENRISEFRQLVQW
eukprot:GHVP01028274.1.p1 GENE.GHVP01028274.1~~GHVP01028274.1.p1  ORF type:complete len:375 (+),score=75.48 GHVP01028274.1:33-1157(+)